MLPPTYVFEGMRALLIDRVFRADLMIEALAQASALLAFETGALVACQDPGVLMAEEAIDLVWRNIAAGNLAALTLIRSGPGRKN